MLALSSRRFQLPGVPVMRAGSHALGGGERVGVGYGTRSRCPAAGRHKARFRLTRDRYGLRRALSL
ncbi:hypothetical protein APY04_2272 [Hyphomicrobium sulfonivorans]|uniref:Uncharacterized protein n=1 Tax=Hyphomicrobium sulfonivorans TaxID=121290 RepID=A0A120CUV8_HYPSL|nr:hypothetical protein APY04_2272 [Hyphomicrobium sulfonivorans]